MYLTGQIKVDSELYYIVWNDIKSAETFWIFCPYHSEDYVSIQMGKQAIHPVIPSEWAVKQFYDNNYVIEILKRKKVSGEVTIWGNPQIIDRLLDVMSFARNYRFNNKDITDNTHMQMGASNLYKFKAVDNHLVYEYERDDFHYHALKIVYSGIEVQFQEANFSLDLSKFPLNLASNLYKKKILSQSIKTITYETLCESLDMSWYKIGDKLLKVYKSISNIRDFELQIMTPLVLAILDCMNKNTVLDVAVDTETTGLNVYALSKDNPDKDHVVAIPITWIADQAFVIFTDMEHFSNVDNDYVVHRLAEIFEKFEGERAITIWESNDNNSQIVQDMNLFGDTESIKDQGKDLISCHKRVVFITRNAINLIGHNVMFDKRAFIDSDCYFWFNNDTLQMSFNLHSKTVKGSNKLKTLTRKVFGHETPELTDILGKNNEDKYRFLVDKEVAEIYGCADADYTLQLFWYLRKLTKPEMYTRYQALDVPMLNILPRSEYYGLPMIADKVAALGETVYKNIEVLKEFAYEYVGIYVNAFRKREAVEARKAAGWYSTDDEYEQALRNIRVDNSLRFEFEFKPNELRHVLFEILKYPVKDYTNSHQPKLDKFTMEKLIDCERDSNDTDFNKLNQDILSSDADREEYKRLRELGTDKANKKANRMVLISAKEFNRCKYPLALVLQKYAELNKEYTAYYKPMQENNLEGKIFKSYSLARIETRRIQNAAQTMKGDLKALVRSYNDDYYMLDFDMSQVEYRIMLSLAKHMLMIEKMKDPEKDYHTETASLINDIPAHKVDKKTRKKAKGVSFGVPYGLGERRLCSNLFKVVNDETLLATRLLLAKWEKANKPIMDFLNAERDNALVARNMENELRDFMDAWEKDEDGNYLLDMYGNKVPSKVGFAYDNYGFYRTFNLKKVGQEPNDFARRAKGIYTNDEGKIRRPAGNFPIQCFAAELFRIILIRFYERCEREGINDKIIWHMLIHDELLCSVHKSIHPFFLYKIVKESCMVTMKGHTRYYVGINIGNTWAETKDDEREAPVYFVDRIIKRWDAGEFGSGPFWFDDPWNEIIRDERRKYVSDRIGEVIHQVQPNIDNEPINMPYIFEHFDNYTVRAYVDAYDLNHEIPKCDSDDEKADRIWASKFETWALEKFPEGKPLINYDGKMTTLRAMNYIEAEEADTIDDLIALFEDEDDVYGSQDTYWSFDSNELNATFDIDIYENYDDDVFSYEIDESVTHASNIAQMLLNKTKYKNLNVMSEQAVITISKKYVQDIKAYLEDYSSKSGKNIVFSFSDIGGAERWIKVNDSLKWEELDSFIDSLKVVDKVRKANSTYVPKYFKLIGNAPVITLESKYKFSNCINWLQQYENSNGFPVVLRAKNGGDMRVPFKVNLTYESIDKYIKEA